MQSKKQSLIESLTSTTIGIIIGVVLNLTILPIFGYPVSVVDSLWISVIFTIVSIIRSYIIRRWFNSKEGVNDINWRFKVDEDKTWLEQKRVENI